MDATQKFIAHLKSLNARLESDPLYLAEVQQDFETFLVTKENHLITSIITNQNSNSIGDMIMSALEPGYPIKIHQEAYDLFCQFHGNGD